MPLCCEELELTEKNTQKNKVGNGEGFWEEKSLYSKD
jgi:hypothetical protein